MWWWYIFIPPLTCFLHKVEALNGGQQPCGGTLTAVRGLLQTPNFPKAFPEPLHCQWLIDSSNVDGNNVSIVVYLTQLFVLEGLTFTEYTHYTTERGPFGKFGERLIHSVSESNVSKTRWFQTYQRYLLVEFKLDRIANNHLRVLDDLLDVYGFNITYEISTSNFVRTNSCIAKDCSYNGHCYDYFTKFGCVCFEGFTGKRCDEGPKSLCHLHGKSDCQNGGTCRHVGASFVDCHCPNGFKGDYCEIAKDSLIGDASSKDGCTGEPSCVLQCPYDGQPCNCEQQAALSTHITNDVIQYEWSLKFSNPSSAEHAQVLLDRQISKYLNATKVDALVPGAGVVPDVAIYLSGASSDSGRIREVLQRILKSGRLGNITLDTTQLRLRQETALFLRSLRINRQNLIREGEEFILTCTASGSPNMAFRWYKDGAFVNVTKATRDNIWTRLEPTSQDQYSAFLGISRATLLDEGVFTCQVEDQGVQQCRSIRVEILLPPEIDIHPMSLTVLKGESFTIKCMSSNDRKQEKYTYNWTKDKKLLPVRTAAEKYEILYHSGSILQVFNIKKPVVYSCLVHGSVTREMAISVAVIDRALEPFCPETKEYEVQWSQAASHTTSLQNCPPGFQGIATRFCTVRDTHRAEWLTPDFSACVSNSVGEIMTNFSKLALGYETTTPMETLQGYLGYVFKRKNLLPGEGDKIVHLMQKVFSYVVTTGQTLDEIRNQTKVAFDIINYILEFDQAIVNQGQSQQLAYLHDRVKNQALMLGINENDRSNYQQHSSAISLIYISSLELFTFYRIPTEENKVPSWFTDKFDVQIRTLSTKNQQIGISIVVYKNLTKFLPHRFAIRYKEGMEYEYEIMSRVIGVWLENAGKEISGVGSVSLEMELQHPAWNFTSEQWSVKCALVDLSTPRWNLDACITRPITPTSTVCNCSSTGTFALLLSSRSADIKQELISQHTLLFCCALCMLLSLSSASMLTFYWCHRRSSLIFLKLQCCAAIAGAMAVFIYVFTNNVQHESYMYITTFLETFLLVGLSTHLSKPLVVLTELVLMPQVGSLRPTVVGIITGVPMIAVFGNHLAHQTMDRRFESWWLLVGSLAFNIFVTCALMLLVLFVFAYLIVTRKLKALVFEHVKSSKILGKRMALLHRAAVVFSTMLVMIISSIVHVNFPHIVTYYVFSFSVASLGIAVLFCYVLKSETSLGDYLIKQLKFHGTNDEYCSSDSVNIPLNFFTKQEPETESESVPSRRKAGVGYYNNMSQMESCSKLFYGKAAKMSTGEPDIPMMETTAIHSGFNPMLETTEVDMLRYQNSPRHLRKNSPSNMHHHQGMGNVVYSNVVTDNLGWGYVVGGEDPSNTTPNSPDILATRVCVELDLVASSFQPQNQQQPSIVVPAQVQVNNIPVIKTRDEESAYNKAEKPTTRKLSNLSMYKAEDTEVQAQSTAPLREQPDGRAECFADSATDAKAEKTPLNASDADLRSTNLDGMLERISHDLDYLLNDTEPDDAPVLGTVEVGTTSGPTGASPHVSAGHVRRISKPPAESVNERIDENEEESVNPSES